MTMTADVFYKIMNRDAKEEEEVPESSQRRRGMHSSRQEGSGRAQFRRVDLPNAADRDWPLYGKMSLLGRQRCMEDAVDVQMSFCRPAIAQGKPVHFFGVFDGYGGAHVAAACSLQMHVYLREELMRVVEAPPASGPSGGGDWRREKWREAMKRAFWRMDQLAMSICICGRLIVECGGCRHIELVHAGSTALVAVLTPEHIVVANCGNSRAVLCRGGRAISLSRYHKPDRADELARIVAAGGRVIEADGLRVEGILPISRAIGDKHFKPAVTPDPETTIIDRNVVSDDCLILASDGLWNEMSVDLACRVVSRCLREGGIAGMDLNAAPQTQRPSSDESPTLLAATLLTRLALGRKSTDNISVVVIDLKKR